MIDYAYVWIIVVIRIVVHTWMSIILSKSLVCGGKAAGDPIYKHRELVGSRILLSVCTHGFGWLD